MPDTRPPPSRPDAAAQGGKRRTLAASARGADRLLGPVLALAAGLLVAGWLLPIMTVHRLVIFADRVSILQGAAELWRGGENFLAALVVVFSVVFPALKLLLAAVLWYGIDAGAEWLARALDWLEALGRWSMLDVFVIALTVVAIQISLIGQVSTHAGLYVFVAAVLLSMVAVRRMLVLARRAARAVQEDGLTPR